MRYTADALSNKASICDGGSLGAASKINEDIEKLDINVSPYILIRNKNTQIIMI